MKKISILVTALIIMPLKSSAQDLESRLNEPIKIQRINSPVTLNGMSYVRNYWGFKNVSQNKWAKLDVSKTAGFGTKPLS
ncbi:hypothetical protein ACFLZA_01350 [Candidatus Neomarinimicrobiota bacterium]